MTPSSSARAERADTGRLLLLALGIALVCRLATLGLYPLTDTTEARYAEVARKMLELGDWTTPWYAYGVPFWAKPPLSTWLTAGSFKLFGVNEFAARLPHLLLAVVIGWLVWDWLRRRDGREALLALTLLAGSILVLVASGAVMTDMALALGATMTMRGLWLGMFGAPQRRGAEFSLAFVGVAIGLLAKGPVILPLTLLPLAVWALATSSVGVAWRAVPWLRGGLLAAALAVPWYLLAEHATPGFLDYFLVGEHWQRFTVSGWQGDRYGNAHAFPRGTMLLFAAFAFLPWSVLLPLLAIGRKSTAAQPAAPQDRSLAVYLLCWALAPCVFFLAARNILWTYVLPGMPAAAMLAALWLRRDSRRRLVDAAVALGTVGATLTLCVVLGVRQENISWKSAKDLVLAWRQHATAAQPLVFLDVLPYSASFYSDGRAKAVKSLRELEQLGAARPIYLGLAVSQVATLTPDFRSRLKEVGSYGRYRLFVFLGEQSAPSGPPSSNVEVVDAAWGDRIAKTAGPRDRHSP